MHRNAVSPSLLDTQCLISHRPSARCQEPNFYRCHTCGALVIGHGDSDSVCFPCPCGQRMEQLIPDAGGGADHLLTYAIFGGMAHNAIRIWVDEGRHPMEQTHRIDFLYLHTYEGGQLKYLLPGQSSSVTFALAGEDAYAYCDRPLCHMGRDRCQFQCKRGWVIYACCSRHGLRRLAL